ncbi:protein SEC13 homolog [Eupeodes corollae]|uniref:protein SEC13 homolog n=1 Tax=Eupeodes corollae TaxID=290404 RepID=UPI0024907841|nr:protein SEC13 homolog [Eupeodes corollae]
MVSLINTIETCHNEMIHGSELDYYCLYLATCASDNAVKIFDIKNEEHVLVAELMGHRGPVWEVSWAHPKFGNVLASCSYDRKVIVWKKTGSAWRKSYEYSSESSINSISWAPHEYGMVLACASSDGSISFLNFNPEHGSWDSEKIPNAHAIGCNSVSWYPSFASMGTLKQSTKRLASGGCDNFVKIWIERNGRWFEETRLEAHSDWVRHVEWAPSYGGCKTQIASASQDRHVIIWRSDNMISWTSITLNVFDDVVWSVSWSLTGKMLAVTGADSKISVWKENSDHYWSCVTD